MKRPALLVLFGAALALASACQEPTEARLLPYTNLAFDSSARMTIFTGRTVAELSPQASSVPDVQWGQDGLLGSLVFVPPGGNANARVAVRTVLALGRDPATCSERDPVNCIFADRQLNYQKGTTLKLPVGLFRQCLGVVCPSGRTCNYEGSCVSADVDTSSCASDLGCTIAGDPPVPTGVQQPPALPTADAGTDTGSQPGPAAPLAPMLAIRDVDPRQGFVDGTLSVTSRPGSAPVTRVELSYPLANGQPGAPFATIGTLPGTYTFFAAQALPKGVEDVMAVAVAQNANGQSASPATRIRIDNYPRVKDVGADLGTDVARGATFFPDASAPASKLLVFGVDGSKRPTLRRCNSDGSSCVGSVLGPSTSATQAATSLAISGKGALVVVTDGGKMLRCTADGSSCDAPSEYSDDRSPVNQLAVMADPQHAGGHIIVRSVYSSKTDQSTVEVTHCEGDVCTSVESLVPGRVVQQQPARSNNAAFLVSQKRDTARSSYLLRCDLGTGSCTSKALAAGFVGATVALQGTSPWVLGRVAGVPQLLDCTTASCVAQTLPGAVVPTLPEWTPALTFDGSTPVLFYRNAQSHLVAARCPAAASCAVTDVSVFAINGFDPASASVFVDSQSKLVIGGTNYDGTPGLVRCTGTLSTCIGASNGTQELAGNTVGDALDAVVDASTKRLSVVTANAARGTQSTLFSCDLDATNCVARDVSVNGLPGSGYFPSIAGGAAGGKLTFVVDDRSVEREAPGAASLVTCDPDGKNCSSRVLFPAVLEGDVDFLSDGTNFAQRTKKGRLRVFHQNEFGSYEHETLDCDANGNGCVHKYLTLNGFMLRNLAYDEVTDLSYLASPYSEFNLVAYGCTTDVDVADNDMCHEFPVLEDIAEGFSPQIVAISAEATGPVFLVSYISTLVDPPEQVVALVRCPGEVCGAPEPLPIKGVPQFGFYPRSAMAVDVARGVRYIALGDDDSGSLTLDRCTAKGCTRLYSFPFETTPPFRLLVDAASDRLFLVVRDDNNRGRPATLTLDLY